MQDLAGGRRHRFGLHSSNGTGTVLVAQIIKLSFLVCPTVATILVVFGDITFVLTWGELPSYRRVSPVSCHRVTPSQGSARSPPSSRSLPSGLLVRRCTASIFSVPTTVPDTPQRPARRHCGECVVARRAPSARGVLVDRGGQL